MLYLNKKKRYYRHMQNVNIKSSFVVDAIKYFKQNDGWFISEKDANLIRSLLIDVGCTKHDFLKYLSTKK